MTEKKLIIQELKNEIAKEEKMIEDLDTKITAAYMCANDHPLRRDGFERDAHDFEKQRTILKDKVQWKRSVLSKYHCW